MASTYLGPEGPSSGRQLYIQVWYSECLLHVSSPLVHLQEDDCIYRYDIVFYMHQYKQYCSYKNMFDTDVLSVSNTLF